MKVGSPLSATDYERLAASWIDSATAERSGLRRVDSAEGAALIGRNGSGDYAGIAYPYFLPGSDSPREWRLRLDNPPLEQSTDGTIKEKQKYIAQPGSRNPAYFPPGVTPEQLADTALPVVLTEGEKKTLACGQLAWHGLSETAEHPRFIPLGLSGVWNWRGTVGKDFDANGARCDVKGPIADLDRLAWEDRRTYIVFDADVSSNPSVGAARRELAKELARRGADVRLVNLPEQSGGVDDLLASAGPETVLRLFDQAAEIDPSFRLTELGMAERFAYQHGSRVRYCHAWGKWLCWDGARWAKDDTGAVERMAVDTVRSLYGVAAKTTDATERADIAKFAARSESDKAIRAVLSRARSIEGIPVRPDDLDADPWLLNCENGTLDLRAGKLRRHRRADLITKLCPIAFDPAATAPAFLAFLDRILSGNAALIQFLQRAIGYALTGGTSEQVVFILWGNGANGKSTLILIVLEMLGDYGLSTPSETFEVRAGGIPNDVARLKGARLVAAVETEEGRRLAESRIKQMTGSDRLAARFLHAEWFEFAPQFKVFLATNHKPDIQGTDHAIWRRIRLVPFTVTIPDDEQDHELPEKLRAELPGILTWAVRGCLDWQREGLGMPDEVRAATEAYRSETDRIGRFVAECCITGEYATAKARALYTEYRKWAGEAGETVLTETAFARRMAELGYKKRHTEHGKTYSGIGLLAERESA